MRRLWQEFKEFAFKGNMIDLAIAVIIGSAFAKVIDALVKAVIMPLVGYLPGLRGGYADWHVGAVQVGVFISELVNFLIIAAAVFVVVVKGLSVLKVKSAAPPAPSEPTVKECPYCLSEIPLKAGRCRYCASDQPTQPGPAPLGDRPDDGMTLQGVARTM